MPLQPENVQEYPRPPRLEPVAERLRIVLGGVEVASTDRALRVLETHHAPTYYIPMSDFAEGALVSAPGRSFCEWKGTAAYFHVEGGGKRVPRAAWTYPAPTRSFAELLDHVAVYAEPMDACFVGSERVTPQPGNFYGGWVTSNLSGIVKGGPGTEGW